MDTPTVAAIIMGILQLFMGVVMALMGMLINNLIRQVASLQVELTNLRVSALSREEYRLDMQKRDAEVDGFEAESRKDRHRLRNIVNGLCVKLGYIPPQTQEDLT